MVRGGRARWCRARCGRAMCLVARFLSLHLRSRSQIPSLPIVDGSDLHHLCCDVRVGAVAHESRGRRLARWASARLIEPLADALVAEGMLACVKRATFSCLQLREADRAHVRFRHEVHAPTGWCEVLGSCEVVRARWSVRGGGTAVSCSYCTEYTPQRASVCLRWSNGQSLRTRASLGGLHSRPSQKPVANACPRLRTSSSVQYCNAA